MTTFTTPAPELGARTPLFIVGRTDNVPPVPLFTEAEWGHLASVFGLTPRQCQIARLMCAGLTYKSVGAHVSISINTVRMHMRALFAKLGVHDRVSLVLQLVAAERLRAQPAEPTPGSV